MRDLAVQWHNGTLSADDQDAIKCEARQLASEALAIGDQTSFNGIPLLTTNSTVKFQVGADDGETIDVDTHSLRGVLNAMFVEDEMQGYEYYSQPAQTTIDMVETGPSSSTNFSYTIPADASMTDVQSIINNDPNSPVYVSARYDAAHNSYAFGFFNKQNGPGWDVVATGASIVAWTGPNSSAPAVESAPAFELGSPNDLDEIDAAIAAVSDVRSQYGAAQNRVEHRLNNVLNYEENLTAAESRIRDADMAHEATELTKSGILVQAATTMLSQANQAPNMVLTLLGHQ
jgi:flagellin